MKNRSRILTFAVMVVVFVGLVPLFYFATVKIGIVRADTGDTSRVAPGENAPDRYVENVAFGVNEKLTFEINYGFINAGGATMEVNRLIEFSGRPCYQIVTRAFSNSFFSTFYKVDDRVESIIDAIGIFTWRFEKNLREGNYRADRLFTFDQHRDLVYSGKDTVAVPRFTQDALSALYFVRTQDLEVGKSIFVDNFTDGEHYPLEVKILRREEVTVPAGTFECVVVEPLLQSVGVFRHEGNLTVWLTDDRLKMPVLMKSKVLVGSISAELNEFRLGDIETF